MDLLVFYTARHSSAQVEQIGGGEDSARDSNDKDGELMREKVGQVGQVGKECGDGEDQLARVPSVITTG